MKTWWYGLAPRERLWVVLGVILISLTLVWFYAIKPLFAYQQSLVTELHDSQSDTVMLNNIAPEIENAQQTSAALPSSNESLQRLLEAALQEYQLDKPEILEKLDNTRSGAVNISLKAAPFDQIARMLGSMELRHNAKATQLTITPTDQVGLVSANITLKR